MHNDTDHKKTSASSTQFDLGNTPTQPGCYIMRDEDGHILYVGKAKNLRSRLRNYINATDSRYSVKFLMQRVSDIECLTVATEKEALLLENSLIKAHKPRYNVRLRDDKTYISIRLDPSEEFPRLTVVRRRKNDGAKYFGPYHDTRAARKTIRQLQRLIPLRVCSNHVLQNRARPCIYYQMRQCHAPCVGLIDTEAYGKLVEQALLIFEGRTGELEKQMKEEMAQLSDALRFEEAAAVRDRLADLRTTMEPQRTVMQGKGGDRDVFGYYIEGRFIVIQVLYYRKGAMVGGTSFPFDRIEAPVDEILSSFLLQYYDSAPALPPEILLPCPLEDLEALAEILRDKRKGPVKLRIPKRGAQAKLVLLAASNARSAFLENRGREKAARDALALVRDVLRLPKTPERIECFDVSTIQGDSTVAAMVVFEGGEPSKGRYRRYAIRNTKGQDDFAAMREALERRYTRALRENDLPDLVLIDGGKGHLHAALTVLDALGLGTLPCAGIAKSRNRSGDAAFERFFIPNRGNPIVPPQNGPVVRLLSRVRDEAHRFAITYHRKKRSKARLRTSLLDIPGVGAKTAQRLLAAFGSVSRIRDASLEELVAVPSINDKLARVILNALKQHQERS